MSWTIPSDKEKEYVLKLKRDHILLYKYACYLALALKVDSTLLRNLRKRFLPSTSATLELDIWYAPFVHTRNIHFATFRTGIARTLCEEFKTDNLLLYNKVKSEIASLTRHWSELDQIQQKLRWATLEQSTDTQLQILQRILKTIITAENDFDKRELARWIKGILPLLNNNQLQLKEAQWLQQYVAASIGITSAKTTLSSLSPLPTAISNALPQNKSTFLGVEVYPGVLKFIKASENTENNLAFNLSLPTNVKIGFGDETSDMWHTVWANREISIPNHIDTITLETIVGEHYSIYVETLQNERTNEEDLKPAPNLTLAFVKEDSDKLKALVEILEKQNIKVNVVEEALITEVADPDTQIIRIWSKHAEQYWQSSANFGSAISNSILLLMDSTPAPQQNNPKFASKVIQANTFNQAFEKKLLSLINNPENRDSSNIENQTEFDAEHHFSTLTSIEKEWLELEQANLDRRIVFGKLSDKIKGGFTVQLKNILGFLPGSLVDIRPVSDISFLEGKELELHVIKVDRKRNSVVVSRRSVIESGNSVERDNTLKSLQEGQEVEGVVMNITDYGAFVDIGGVDGLVHITDMAWKRLKHPNEMVNIGDEVQVKVLKFDRERTRIVLGMKQLGEDPWLKIPNRYPEGAIISGHVSMVTEYGCFVEIIEGVEGLVHISEMDWVDKIPTPSKIVSLDETVKVMVLEIDEERRRISLGLKQCRPNPWEEFAKTFYIGDKVDGSIIKITSDHVWIGLQGGLYGLMSISSLPNHLIGKVDIGEHMICVIDNIDVMEGDVTLLPEQYEGEFINEVSQSTEPWDSILSMYKEGSKVKVPVTRIFRKGIAVDLYNGVEGVINSSEIDWTSFNPNPEDYVHVGQKIEVMVLEVDKDYRRIALGMKQCKPNPWEEFANNFNKGDKVSGKVTAITDFGIFIGLDGGIDGLVHLSDISWDAGTEAIQKYKKGDEVSAVVLQVDPERERISLGVKQTIDDPFNQ